jgi:hypothetical protein
MICAHNNLNMPRVTGGREARKPSTLPSTGGAPVFKDKHVEKVVSILGVTPNECASGAPNDTCVPEDIADKVAAAVGVSAPTADEKMIAAMETTGCDTVACTIKKSLPKDVAKSVIQVHLKKEGPRDSTALLSNFDIDETIEQWRREYPDMHHIPYAMIDFATADHGRGLDAADISKAAADGVKSVACVLNTDVSTGPGKHWVCIHCDLASRPCTLEYFNSAGNPTPPQVLDWLEKQKALLREAGIPADVVGVTDVRHQDSRTECGIYVLYYLRSRIVGIPLKHFFGARISDDSMTEFRKLLFRNKSK